MEVPVQRSAVPFHRAFILVTLVLCLVSELGMTAVEAAPKLNSLPSSRSPPKPAKRPPTPKPVKISPPPKPVMSRPPPKPVKSLPPPKPVKSPPPPTPFNLTSGGVRLVRGAGSAGRLEVKVGRAGVFAAGYYQNGGWATLCDDGSFGAPETKLFCGRFGYKYGRLFYKNGVSSFGPDEPSPLAPLGFMVCDGDGQSWLRDRLPVGRVEFKGDQGYGSSDLPMCLVFNVDCPRKTLVALECSDTPFSSTPPPPPSPPSPPPPPPPPPSRQEDIQLVPTVPGTRKSVAVVRVNSSSDGRTGPAVWAPLCATADDVANPYSPEADRLAVTICKQLDGFRFSPSRWVTGSPAAPVAIPEEVETGGFDPSTYKHWLTVVNGTNSYTVQDMRLQVSTQPCASGHLFTVQCMEIMV